ncbi:MAG TPA: APC family permease [Candidatus Polarisedimenticolaceae bacterium]|nr:APC family permease [Candidatus Polarisedimenticolaceae bacterium]
MPERAHAKPPTALRLGALVAVMYFIVSGGPFGLEGLVGSVGPGLALVILVATPLLYSLPEALLVGELASMLPLEGGYYQWVKRAFGPFWGFWNGWLSWVYSLVDMAIYPVLLIQYLGFFVPELGRVESWAIAVAMIWIATLLNLRGTRAVGQASGWFVAIVLAPFAAIVAFAVVKLLGSNPPSAGLSPFHATGKTFLGAVGIGVSQAIWNYSGWDNASTISGEIEDASRSYPRAIARALPFVTIVYLAATVPVLLVTDWTTWTDGAWPALATAVAGRWLGAWMAIAGMVSAFALFNALLLAYSRIPLVLAQDGLLPASLGEVDDRGVPRNAVIVSAIGYSVCAVIPFGGLLAGDVLLYTAALAMEFAALLQLRRAEPELRGAFRVPLGVPGLAVLAALPMLLIGGAVVLEIQSHEIGLPGVVGAIVLALIGPVWYRLAARRDASG